MGFSNVFSGLANLFNPASGYRMPVQQQAPLSGDYGGGDFVNARYGDTYIDLMDAVKQRMSPYENVFNQMQANLPRSGPNLILPNNGYFADHPALSRGIENGLFALSNMGPSSMNAGDNIANVARGLVGGAQQQRQEYIARAQMPLNIEMQKIGLEDKLADSYYKLGHAAYFMNGGRALANQGKAYQHYENRTDGLYGITADGAAVKIPGIPGKGLAYGGGLKTLPERLAFANGFDPEEDPTGFATETQRLASVMAGQQAGSRAGATTAVDRRNGGLSDTDQRIITADWELAKNQLLDPKGGYKTALQAKRLGIKDYKNPSEWEKYNQGIVDTFKESHQGVDPSGGAFSKSSGKKTPSKAVAPSPSAPSAAPRLTPEQVDNIIKNAIGN